MKSGDLERLIGEFRAFVLVKSKRLALASVFLGVSVGRCVFYRS